ncbi:HU family DNA-binding protein [bacterium]|nr:HU family DNA-binding protein [bacterium]
MATTTGAAAKTTATATKPFGKIELIDAVAKVTKLEKTKVKAVIEATFETIEAQLKKKSGTNRVQLTGFGTFAVAKRKARTGVNPKTGEKIKIAARNVPKFTPGKALRDSVA